MSCQSFGEDKYFQSATRDKQVSNIQELSKYLMESFKEFYSKFEKLESIEDPDTISVKSYEILEYLKDSFYIHQPKFSDICIDIEDYTSDINDILDEMELDLENIFWTNDDMFDDLIEKIGDKEKTIIQLNEIRSSITTRFMSFNRKLKELSEILNE